MKHDRKWGLGFLTLGPITFGHAHGWNSQRRVSTTLSVAFGKSDWMAPVEVTFAWRAR